MATGENRRSKRGGIPKNRVLRRTAESIGPLEGRGRGATLQIKEERSPRTSAQEEGQTTTIGEIRLPEGFRGEGVGRGRKGRGKRGYMIPN